MYRRQASNQRVYFYFVSIFRLTDIDRQLHFNLLERTCVSGDREQHRPDRPPAGGCSEQWRLGLTVRSAHLAGSIGAVLAHNGKLRAPGPRTSTGIRQISWLELNSNLKMMSDILVIQASFISSLPKFLQARVARKLLTHDRKRASIIVSQMRDAKSTDYLPTWHFM